MTLRILSAAAAAVLIAACAEQPDTADPAANGAVAVDLPQPSGPPLVQQAQEEEAGLTAPPRPGWESAGSGEGTSLRLVDAEGTPRLSIACVAGPPRLVANVPSFTPVGSEDRFTLGLGTEPVTLVADPTDQEDRPGVTGEAPVPPNISTLLRDAARISIVYGYQRSGPHDPPPAELRAALGAACDDLRS